MNRCPLIALRWMLFFLLLLVPLHSSAQEGAAVLSGRVLDVSNGVAIAFASVLVEDPASGRQLSGALTGENGRFLVQGLTPGTYRIRISFPGFLPADADVLVSPLNKAYDLGD